MAGTGGPICRRTYQTAIPYLVKYRCCSCGTYNTDASQVCLVRVRKQSRDEEKLLLQEAEGIRQLKAKAEATVREKQEWIDRRFYDELNLKCRCSACGERQPWSGFRPAWELFRRIARLYEQSGNLMRYFLVYLAMLSVIFFFSVFFEKYPSAGLILLLLPFLPSIAALIHNLLLQKKSMKLVGEYRPEISIAGLPTEYTVLNEKEYDDEGFHADTRENKLKAYKRRMKSALNMTVYILLLMSASLIILNMPAITNETLLFVAGAIKTVFPLLGSYAGLAVCCYLKSRKQYRELAEQAEASENRNQNEEMR